MFYKVQPTASTKPAIFADVWRRNLELTAVRFHGLSKPKAAVAVAKAHAVLAVVLIRGHPLILKTTTITGLSTSTKAFFWGAAWERPGNGGHFRSDAGAERLPR